MALTFLTRIENMLLNLFRSDRKIISVYNTLNNNGGRMTKLTMPKSRKGLDTGESLFVQGSVGSCH